MKIKRYLMILLILILVLGIGLDTAYAYITGRNYGLKVGALVNWNNGRYYVKPHWNIYFNSFSDQQGTAMNFTNMDDSTKGYLVVGRDQWDDWVQAFGADYSSVVSHIDYSNVITPAGEFDFAWLSQIASVCGWKVKDWDTSGQWAIYERIAIPPPPPPPPPPSPANLEISLDSPNHLTPNGNNYLTPNGDQLPFTVKATIRNTGESTAYNVNANITLSSGLNLLDSSSVPLGSLGGGQSKQVTWRINAKTNISKDRVENMTVTSTSTSADTASRLINISVPGLLVIFIPGMMGSDLYVNGQKAWYKPLFNDYDALALNNDGSSVNQIIPREPVGFVYNYMIKFLVDNGFNVETFGYDWRLSNDINAEKLAETINNSKASKVYIVAHSMGGIVANRYKTLGNSNRIAKIVTIGTPYMGSPKSLYGIETGDLVPLTTTSEIQQIAVRSKSAYELLPSQKYFELNDSNPDTNTYYFSKVKINSQGKFETEYYNFNEMLNYLNSGHPVLLNGFAQNADTFQKKLDLNWSGVDAYYIVGYGLNTYGKIQERYSYSKRKKDWVLIKTERLKSIQGDETVPFISGNRGQVIGKYHTWYVEDVSHKDLTSDEAVQSQVLAILTGRNENHLDTTFTLNKTSYALTINSPVSINVYDRFGNGIGPGSSENIIPLASYYEWDHNKFVFLRNGQYDIKLRGTDDGCFTFTVDYYVNEDIINTVLFKDVPVQNGATITSDLESFNPNELVLEVDTNNDGVTDYEVTPTSILDSAGANDITPPELTIKPEGTIGKNNWYTSDVLVNIDAYDEGGSGIKSVDYKVNEEDILPYSAPFIISQEGINTIKALAMDKAGNTTLNIETREVKIDKSSPLITANLQDQYSYGTVADLVYSIKAEDIISGVSNIQVNYDGNPVTYGELTLNQDGIHTIDVLVEDNAGNTQTYSKTFEVYIPAEINFDPDTLNIKNQNPAVATVYIKLPAQYNVNNISLSSILLNGVVSPIQDSQFGYVTHPVEDYDGDGILEFMVKFERLILDDILPPGENVEILITGHIDGVLFKGKDYIKVID